MGKKIKTNRFICIIVIILLISISALGCGKKEKENYESDEKKQVLKIYMGLEDKYSKESVDYLIKGFQDKSENLEIQVFEKSDLDDKLDKKINESEIDIIFTNRNNMLELNKKGLISDFGDIYKENNLSEKGYEAVISYGKINNKYYGIGVLPESYELFYNYDKVKEMGIDIEEESLENIVKAMSNKDITIPFLKKKNVGYLDIITSIIMSKNLSVEKIEHLYEVDEDFTNMPEMKKVFDELKLLLNNGVLKETTFQDIPEEDIMDTIKNNTPIVIGSSKYLSIMESNKYKFVKNLKNNKKEDIRNLVDVRSVMCLPAICNNSEIQGKLIEYMLSEETNKKLSDKGRITFFKEINEKSENINEFIENHIKKATQNDVIFTSNLNEKVRKDMNEVIHEILKK